MFQVTLIAQFDTREQADEALLACEEVVGKLDGDVYENEIAEEDAMPDIRQMCAREHCSNIVPVQVGPTLCRSCRKDAAAIAWLMMVRRFGIDAIQPVDMDTGQMHGPQGRPS